MLNFTRRDNPADAKDAGKSGLKPVLYDPPTSTCSRRVPRGAARQQAQAAAATRELPPAATPTPTDAIAPAGTRTRGAAAASAGSEAPGSKLFIGVNIKLKGVEISDCDVLVIEGHVEATVHSKAMQIDKPGTLERHGVDRRRRSSRRFFRRADRAHPPGRARHRPRIGQDPLRQADRRRRRRVERRRQAHRRIRRASDARTRRGTRSAGLLGSASAMGSA